MKDSENIWLHATHLVAIFAWEWLNLSWNINSLHSRPKCFIISASFIWHFSSQFFVPVWSLLMASHQVKEIFHKKGKKSYFLIHQAKKWNFLGYSKARNGSFSQQLIFLSRGIRFFFHTVFKHDARASSFMNCCCCCFRIVAEKGCRICQSVWVFVPETVVRWQPFIWIKKKLVSLDSISQFLKFLIVCSAFKEH